MAKAMPQPQSGQLQQQLQQWQAARTWARLIREAECLWHVDVRSLHRLAAAELGQLQGEVPGHLRPRVNRWLQRLGVATRLHQLTTQQKTGWGSRRNSPKRGDGEEPVDR
jgi:hypothetical protein